VTPNSGNALADLVCKRHNCLQQLQKLGQRQSDLIDSGELGSLLRLLSAKNQMIAALQAIENELQPFHDQDPDSRTWDLPATRETCAQQIDQCRVLLENIMQMERENEQKMVARRDHVAQQLQSVQSAGTTRRAYQAQQESLRGPHLPLAVTSDQTIAQASSHQLDLQSGG